MSDWLLLHSITVRLALKIQTLKSQWNNMCSSRWCKAGQLACDGYKHNAFCVVVGTWKSRLPGYYRNPGVKQSRSARFGVKRTEEEALNIVLKWMFAQHSEAEKRALNLSKWFNFSRYHFVSCRYNLGCLFFPRDFQRPRNDLYAVYWIWLQHIIKIFDRLSASNNWILISCWY